MTVRLWGTRGSIASPGPDTVRYGGNTACVEVLGTDGTVLVLDAGTGVRRLGARLVQTHRRVDILLTHLHLDHITGLGFFAPLYHRETAVHIWGPGSTTQSLRARLTRYLSPPLFPVRLRDLPCQLTLHEVPCGAFTVGEFRITSALVCHPGPTVGYRIARGQTILTYMPDHEPALGLARFPLSADWSSGHVLAAGADLLIHDAQYSREEYLHHVGWGHSSLDQALAFARLADVREFVPFHHDPAHGDDDLDRLIAEAAARACPPFEVTPGREGATLTLGDEP